MSPNSRGFLSFLGRRAFRARLPFRPYSTAIAEPAAPSKIKLREYQEDAIQAVLSHLDKGHKRLGLSLATGSGKTVIFTQLIDRIQPKSPDANQTLIIAHRRELVEQAVRHCRLAYPQKTIGIEMGKNHTIGNEDIIVASLQSILSGDRIEKFDPKRFKLVLVDEAHHIVSRGYMETLAHFGLSKAREESPALVGVSATMSRFDGLKLGAAIDHIVYHKDYLDMIEEKWLSQVQFTTVKINADLSKVRLTNGDFQSSELSKQLNNDQINDIIVRSWMHKTKAKSTMAFCADIAHVKGLTNMFRKHGIDARYVTGDTLPEERKTLVEGFKLGKYPVLLNCNVFTEGTDVPNIDCVLLARPTKSRNLLIQMIGRGMRLHPGKEFCHVIDLVASLEAGIVCTPTLFGLDPAEVLDNASMDDMKDLQKKKEENKSVALGQATATRPPTKVTFTDYESVYDLIADTSGESHIRALSPHAWVEVRPKKYILSTQSGYLQLLREVEEDTNKEYFVVLENIKLSKFVDGGKRKSKAPFARPRELARSEALSEALHAADTYAAKKYPFYIISKSQMWRKGPATKSQLDFLNKFRANDEQLTADDSITKGKANDMITKLKHGAKTRFSEYQAEKKRGEKAAFKMDLEAAYRRNEEVQVGPLG